MASYTQQSWVDGTSPVNAERMNHIEEGLGGAVDSINSLDSQVGIINYVDDYNGTNYSSILVAFQTKWEEFPTGVILWRFRVGTRGCAIIWNFSEADGVAIVFGCTSAFNPPRLIRLTESTWRWYNFTVTENS